jgi:ubiquinone/menaquinone biosynthesis C-methylase UbiE
MWIKRSKSSPAFAGEGDHAKHGGGVLRSREEPLHRATRGPPPPRNRGRISSALLLPLLLAACQEKAEESPFPRPQRPVSPIVSASYSNEDARDSVREAQTVMDLADIAAGMYVADIGAGEGYYTVRLAPLVGRKGRVLAEDIVPATRDSLANRVTREDLHNVAVKLGKPNDPMLPDGSFDRVFMIHMYHEIERPSEFLWNLRPDLKKRGRVVVVDADRPTDRHGTPPRLLICEFAAVGYQLTRFERLKDSESYFAQFEPAAARPEPKDIPICPATVAG